MSWLPDWLTGYDSANAARVNERQAELARRAAAARAADDAALADYYQRGEGHGTSTTDDQAAIDATFAEAVGDNAAAMSGAVRDTLAFTVGNIFRAIPLSVWALAAVALFLYMGGGVWLRGRLAR